MTTTLAAPIITWQPVCAAPTTFVLTISGMPVALRGEVEELMAVYLPPAETSNLPGQDIWDMTWFTRWRRDKTTFGARAVACREVLQAPRDDMKRFERVVAKLASDYGFSATLRPA
ncbi:hypothetical protein QP027_07900 [Corynebacterium breve]|uniref:Uncharacterized protein n=1 Tax=Corynebacterium breve TaxID=3049799 RepID=A0ABY8VC40_9CORY|nr:hypothetical protein [Corynebacterium breve]WIM67048.1 hypothetical protein QP027_07900 [Corynebacterium breve]